MQEINKNAAGMAVGLLFGVLHLGWAVLIAINQAKPLMDWILGLHMMSLSYTIHPFSVGTAVLLVVVTTVIGYIVGWVAAALWNAVKK